MSQEILDALNEELANDRGTHEDIYKNSRNLTVPTTTATV